jgi:hypothetical protein
LMPCQDTYCLCPVHCRPLSLSLVYCPMVLR